jgi:hypothetical protein
MNDTQADIIHEGMFRLVASPSLRCITQEGRPFGICIKQAREKPADWLFINKFDDTIRSGRR